MLKNSSAIIVILQILLCMVVLFCSDITVNVVLSLVAFILGFFLIYSKKRKFLTFATIFAFLSYILHMGNLVVVKLFGYDNNFLNFDTETVNRSILFCMLCHTALFWGGASGGKRKKRWIPLFYQPINKNCLIRVGLVCCIFGIYPRIYTLINQLLIAQVKGYTGILEGENYGIVSILMQFYYVGILLLIYGFNEKKNISRMILLFSVFIEVFSMFTGGRMYAMSMIVAMAYVYLTQVERPKIKTVVFGAIAVYFLSIVMASIASVRMQGEMGIGNVLSTIIDSAYGNNPIVVFLAEMGGTMIDVIYGIKDFPSHTSHGFGMSYVDSVFSVVPYYEANIAKEINLYFVKGFRNYAYLGGSWIGEAYYNFSWLGCVFCFVIGKIFGSFEDTFDICKKRNEYSRAIVILSFAFYCIGYSRDYFYKFSTTIQVCFVVIIISVLVRRIRLRKIILIQQNTE